MMDLTIAEALICQRIDAEAARLTDDFEELSRFGCGIAVLDNLLPPELFEEAARCLPPKQAMIRRRSLGERKYCWAQTGHLPPTLRTCIAAFASRPVAEKLGRMLDLGTLEPDETLYNGGVTLMAPGDFMRPHLDNSHDRHRSRRRRLAALFYLSSPWQPEQGGNLTIWSRKPMRQIKTIAYKPNRLVLMQVNECAWHSVDPVFGTADRANLTTYFYDSASTSDAVRLTRFMGWPGELATRAMLECQFHVRTAAQRLGADRFVRNPHVNLPT